MAIEYDPISGLYSVVDKLQRPPLDDQDFGRIMSFAHLDMDDNDFGVAVTDENRFFVYEMESR